jgi:hypothetical protein
MSRIGTFLDALQFHPKHRISAEPGISPLDIAKCFTPARRAESLTGSEQQATELSSRNSRLTSIGTSGRHPRNRQLIKVGRSRQPTMPTGSVWTPIALQQRLDEAGYHIHRPENHVNVGLVVVWSKRPVLT